VSCASLDKAREGGNREVDLYNAIFQGFSVDQLSLLSELTFSSFCCSASGTNAVAIDNKIEQAMVSQITLDVQVIK